ncbi:hypothetical protein Ccrd_004429 [Cynara cardunculus var. scolymus]|uniref:Uncharacterized protein n=1 Tax=Cynara cardunculus var. scolymus TaxID=59895 RepID=A0A124SCE2_CYNCS|nr:hypothetical protein Ccrd_004429 [Cynara cardunculus var. scolymus]
MRHRREPLQRSFGSYEGSFELILKLLALSNDNLNIIRSIRICKMSSRKVINKIRIYDSQDVVPCHHILYEKEPQEQCMQECQLWILVSSVAEMTAND